MIKFVATSLLAIAATSLFQAVLSSAAASQFQIQAISPTVIIVDKNGKRIRGAIVTIENREIKRQFESNRVGEFTVDLPLGVYSVTVEHYGSKFLLPRWESHAGEILTITFPFPPSPILHTDPLSIHLNGKVKGTILSEACEVLPEAKITFRNKKQLQIITPDSKGQFLVDLPTGDYLAMVQLASHSAHKITSRKLRVERDKNGDICMWVDTGMEVDPCVCFAPKGEGQILLD
jgi:hypothetical protein